MLKNNKLGFMNSLYKIKQKQSIKKSILGKLTCSISMQIPKDKNMKFAIKGTDFLKKVIKSTSTPNFSPSISFTWYSSTLQT